MKQKNITLFFLLFLFSIFCLLIISGCETSSDAGDGEGKIVKSDNPSIIVDEFYKASVRCQHRTVKQYLTAELRKQIDDDEKKAILDCEETQAKLTLENCKFSEDAIRDVWGIKCEAFLKESCGKLVDDLIVKTCKLAQTSSRPKYNYTRTEIAGNTATVDVDITYQLTSGENKASLQVKLVKEGQEWKISETGSTGLPSELINS